MREVWTLYKEHKGWLTDNDTLVEWVIDVDFARWFPNKAEVLRFIDDYNLNNGHDPQVCPLYDCGLTIVRLK